MSRATTVSQEPSFRAPVPTCMEGSGNMIIIELRRVDSLILWVNSRFTTSRRSTSNPIIFKQKEQQSPKLYTEVVCLLLFLLFLNFYSDSKHTYTQYAQIHQKPAHFVVNSKSVCTYISLSLNLSPPPLFSLFLSCNPVWYTLPKRFGVNTVPKEMSYCFLFSFTKRTSVRIIYYLL